MYETVTTQYQWLMAEQSGRYDKLFDEYARLRATGQSSIPPKIAPASADPETAYVRAQEAGADDPLIGSLMAEGYTLGEAQDIKRDAIERYAAGEA